MKTLSLLLAFCFFGVIDQIHGNAVLVEFEMSDNKLEYMHIPRSMIPCTIKEGDRIQFIKDNDTLKVNCAPFKERK
ncbi:MAG: hypothetical protein CME70_19070 [Halobacteriovorax sp.]|nr:hypothetical protein [Halobacteriovorax sp.]|tara:strand:- start:11 stop:238 length:228 start_codon:yes stop_codon:yes gene_type:complete